MRTIQINDRQGEEILTRDADGLCRISTLATMHDEATATEPSQVRGWPGFDGDNRQWHKLDGAAWEFCFRA
ncbi:MAG: hypothetical protein U9Q07_04120 [Planctomycetota bacterium]|nr:hypothetical protein [Planctomycetota bacterium]